MSGLISLGYFLVSLFLSSAISLLWLRIALGYFRVSSLHPLSQFVYQLTAPVLQPVEQWLYSKRHRMSRFDGVSFLFIVVLDLLKFFLISMLLLPAPLPTPYLFFFTMADLIIQPCNLLFYAILGRVLLSWVNPLSAQALVDILKLITDPILRWTRRFTPTVSNIDLAPFFALIILEGITLFIRASMPLNLL